MAQEQAAGLASPIGTFFGEDLQIDYHTRRNEREGGRLDAEDAVFLFGQLAAFEKTRRGARFVSAFAAQTKMHVRWSGLAVETTVWWIAVSIGEGGRIVVLVLKLTDSLIRCIPSLQLSKIAGRSS